MANVIEAQKNNCQTFGKDLLVGSISAFISKALLGPMDAYSHRISRIDPQRIKELGIPSTPIRDSVRTITAIIKSEGFFALWRGFGRNMMYFPVQGFNFAMNDFFKRLFSKDREKDGFWIWFGSNLVSGGAAGSVYVFFTHPLDYSRLILNQDKLKVRQGREKQFKDIQDVIRKIHNKKGVFGLYKGYMLSCLSISIYRALYFGVYGSLKSILPQNISHNLLINILIGLMTTFGASLINCPIETVRMRKVKQYLSGEAQLGSIELVKQIFLNEGFQPFLKTATNYPIRFFSGAGVLALYDQFQYYFDNRNQ